LAGTHEDLSRTEPVKGPSNRAFGWVFTGVFLIVAAWPLAFGHAPRWWALIISGLLALITLAAPALLTIPNRLWTQFGLLLHRLISPVVLAILFYIVVTPMGLIMRALGKDPLRLRRGTFASYWIAREPPGPDAKTFHDPY